MSPTPSPSDRIEQYMTKLFRRGESPDFIGEYGDFLVAMAALKTAPFGQSGSDFSFYEEAAQIPLDFLKRRDNLDASAGEMSPESGKGILEHLTEVATIASSSTGDTQRNALAILREIITELRYPFTTTQDAHGTCAPEAMSNQLLLNNPAEWTRIALELLRTGEARTFDKGRPLTLPTGMDTPDGSEDRSLTAAFIQAAIKATYPKEGCTYNNAEDKYVDSSGKRHSSGMDLSQQRAAREALFGVPQTIRATREEWLKNPPVGGLYTSLTWVEGKGRKPPSGHAVVIVGYEASTDQVIFRNPHRNSTWKDGDDIFDEGPLRTCHDRETGLERMDRRAFMSRDPISILSPAEVAAYEPPLAPLKQPARNGWAAIFSRETLGAAVRNGVLVVAGVGAGAGLIGWGANQYIKSVAAASSPVASLDLFGNENNLFGSHQWQALLGYSVAEPAVPKELTEYLALRSSALTRQGGSVCETHRLIVVPPDLDFRKLEELVVRSWAFVKLGDSFQGAVASTVPGLDSLSDREAWALVPRDEFVASSVKDAARGLSVTSMREVLKERAVNYRLASVAEVILDTLHQNLVGNSTRDFVRMCRDTTTGSEPLCVGYDSKLKVFTVGVPTDFALGDIEPGISYDFKN